MVGELTDGHSPSNRGGVGIAVDTLSTLGQSSPHPFSSVVRDWGPESYKK